MSSLSVASQAIFPNSAAVETAESAWLERRRELLTNVAVAMGNQCGSSHGLVSEPSTTVDPPKLLRLPLLVRLWPSSLVRLDMLMDYSAYFIGDFFVFGGAESAVPLPTKVELLDGIKIKIVALGLEHSLVTSGMQFDILVLFVLEAVFSIYLFYLVMLVHENGWFNAIAAQVSHLSWEEI
ncbi:hypothetical protein K1719_001137 [Acacia pycnantha]|nr:hypothetical protein K1719_001137 [Acacia pycnantha]